MQTPLVSIIIPTYNRAHLIGETLDSVVAQTYTNWECIVVDDGSTDETDKLLAGYCIKDNRFQYHHRPSDRPKGANACRNYGFELSKGKYVNWFDSDDKMLEDKLEKQLHLLLKSGKNFTICQSKVIEFNKDNRERLWNKNIYSKNSLEDYIRYQISWQTGAVLYSKYFLEEISIKFDEQLMQSQEYDFHVKLLKISPVYAFDTTSLVNVYSHSDSISYSTNNTLIKATSSIGVKINLLKDKSLNLKKSTKLFLLKDIYRVFFQSIVRKDLKTAFFSYRKFLEAHFYLDFKTKLLFFKHFCTTTLALISYTLTGKGYRFLRISIKN